MLKLYLILFYIYIYMFFPYSRYKKGQEFHLSLDHVYLNKAVFRFICNQECRRYP